MVTDTGFVAIQVSKVFSVRFNSDAARSTYGLNAFFSPLRMSLNSIGVPSRSHPHSFYSPSQP